MSSQNIDLSSNEIKSFENLNEELKEFKIKFHNLELEQVTLLNQINDDIVEINKLLNTIQNLKFKNKKQ